MSEKSNNSKNRNQKGIADEVQEAQKLYGSLRKRKVPVTIAVLICAAVVGFGIWSGIRSGSQGGAPKTEQTAEQVTEQITSQVTEQTTEQTTNQVTEQITEQTTDQAAQPQEQTHYTFRTKEQLADHFERHGVEMGFEDEDAYVEGANRVISSPDALHKLQAEDGDDVYYIEETNEFVVVSGDGYIRTYFEPDDGIDYYERQ